MALVRHQQTRFLHNLIRTSPICVSLHALAAARSCRSLPDVQKLAVSPSAIDGCDPALEEKQSGPDVFICPGIEGAALQMRRRVQLGVALEVLGTQYANYMHISDWNSYEHAMNTFYCENSALLLAVHVIVMWKYHAFLRDALLARHVTRIALVEEGISVGDNPDGLAGELACTLSIETGPWTRRLELMWPRSIGGTGEEVDGSLGKQIPLGKVIELGVLHLDRKSGSIVDSAVLEKLLHGGLVVGKEEILTDVAHANYVFVSQDCMLPFIADVGASGSQAESDSMLAKLQKNEWIHKTCQLRGATVMTFFGNLALLMGIGTVVLWTKPADWLDMQLFWTKFNP